VEALLRTVSVIAELERCGIRFEFVGSDEVRVPCPFHDDRTPSCNINTEKRKFCCHAASCPNPKGDFISFLAGAMRTTRRVIVADLSERYAVPTRKTISSEFVERCHAAIWRAGTLLRELRTRGLTDDDIRRWRLGAREGRVSIPVRDASGAVVNMRYYAPGAPPNEKMKNSPGCGGNVLYPADQLSYEKIVLCGGEVKAIAVASRMNSTGYGAVSPTAGEGSWIPAFGVALRGKDVWVCMDVDLGGRRAASKYCRTLRGVARTVRNVLLPLDPDRWPGGDVNDYFGRAGGTAADFGALLDAATEWSAPREDEASEAEAADIPLRAVTLAEHVGRTVRTRAVVCALDVAPYVVPREVRCDCDRSQDGCASCPVFLRELNPDRGGPVLTVPPDAPALLEMVGATKRELRDAIRRGLGIPECKVVAFVTTTWYNVEDCRLSPQLGITDDAAERSMYPAYCVGHGLESNAPYSMVGRPFPNPRTQQSVLLATRADPASDALSEHDPTSDELADLELFRPLRWTESHVADKLAALYADLAANVTRIYCRDDMHMIMDMAYHSPLVLDLGGHRAKGWVEVLVLGDSSQGKTETATGLMRHYGLGERVDCKNASAAGLIGGLQQVGTRWFITWGVIPMHDRRLIILEELKGASIEVIARLTDMRSSGVAELPKIERRRTHARTRLVCLSNPRSGRTMREFNFGVEAVSELMGSPEDVRRFDAALLVAASQVGSETIDRARRVSVEHAHTSDACRRLVLWAWTRRPEQVAFEPRAMDIISDAAISMGREFAHSIPLVDSGGARFKLARLSASVACRTFSTNGDRRVVIVRECHAKFVEATIRRLYGAAECGYSDYSRAAARADELLDPGMLESRVKASPFPRDLVEQLLHTTSIELRDLCDWCGWDREDGIELLSVLVRKHALVRDRQAYRKSAAFISLLKALLERDDLSRPEYVEEL
jgi:hypothetical protein